MAALLFLSNCGGGGGGGSGGGGASIGGVASKGLISGGTVTVYSLNSDGTKGDILGTTVTSSDGSYSINIGSYAGNVIIEVTGGTYKDEATGNIVNNTALLRAAANVSGSVSIAVTPLTEIAVRRAGTLTQSNIEAANTQVSNMIGGVNILTTMPADVTNTTSQSASQEAKDYGIALAAISLMIKDNPNSYTDVSAAITAVADDLSDGTLNSTGGSLSNAVSSFVSSSNNQTGVQTGGTQLNDYINTYTTTTIPDVAATADTTAPTVSLTNPSNNATGVAINTAITAAFSETMDSSSITTSTFTVGQGVGQGLSLASGTVSYSGTTATFTPSSNLSYNTTYTATITTGVKDSAGNAMASNYTWIFATGTASDTTAPTSPSVSINSGSSSTTSTSVTLTLSAMDDVGVTGYYASETSTTPSASAAGWISVTFTTSYSANVSFTLSSGDGTKTVYVWFRDSAGNISASSSDSITLGSAPSAPTGVTATGGNGQVSISRGSVSGATSYNIYWSTTSGVTKTTGTKITGAISPYTHTGRTNGTTYYYVVTAVNSYGESSESSQVSGTPTTGTVSLPKTGQTASYSTDDDGTLQKGVAWPSPRFTVGTGAEADCITDNLTGLMWVKSPDTGGTWQQALDYANGLTLCGYSDWRLPNRKELRSLVNAEQSSTATWLNTQGFSNVQQSYYWSSTTYSFGTSLAWYIHMENGQVLSNLKTAYFSVLPVRAGQ